MKSARVIVKSRSDLADDVLECMVSVEVVTPRISLQCQKCRHHSARAQNAGVLNWIGSQIGRLLGRCRMQPASCVLLKVVYLVASDDTQKISIWNYAPILTT